MGAAKIRDLPTIKADKLTEFDGFLCVSLLVL